MRHSTPMKTRKKAVQTIESVTVRVCRDARVARLTEAGQEAWVCWAVGRVVSVSAIEGGQGGRVTEPECTEACKDDKGKGVADDPLQKGIVSLMQVQERRKAGTERTSPTPPRSMRRPPKKR